MSNPAFNIWRDCFGDAPFDWHDRMWRRTETPPGFTPRDVDTLVSVHRARDLCTRRYAWAVPDAVTVAMLAAYSPLIELGAGTGLWASLLAAAGADVVAFDAEPGGNHWVDADAERFFPVARGGDEQLALHPDRTLFLCWPTMCWDVSSTLAAYKRDTLLYLGEWDGCTGWAPELDDETKWEIVERRAVPQWDGINDRLMVFRRVSLP